MNRVSRQRLSHHSRSPLFQFQPNSAEAALIVHVSPTWFLQRWAEDDEQFHHWTRRTIRQRDKLGWFRGLGRHET